MKKKKPLPRLKISDKIRELDSSDLCSVTIIEEKLYIPLDMNVDDKYERYTIDTFTERDYG